MRVMEKVCQTYGLQMQKCNVVGERIKAEADFVFANHSQIALRQLGDFVGSHLIRDPRDAIVSGYFYHLWTEEAWARNPQEVFGGLSYQEHLNSLGQADGITAEINRFAGYVTEYSMRQWNYHDPRVIEIKYEDLIADEPAVFASLFRHYGFTEMAVEKSVRAALEFSFQRMTERSMGTAAEKSHLRTGKPGQWRDVLSREHQSLIKEKLGDLLIQMGYEQDAGW